MVGSTNFPTRGPEPCKSKEVVDPARQQADSLGAFVSLS